MLLIRYVDKFEIKPDEKMKEECLRLLNFTCFRFFVFKSRNILGRTILEIIHRLSFYSFLDLLSLLKSRYVFAMVFIWCFILSLVFGFVLFTIPIVLAFVVLSFDLHKHEFKYIPLSKYSELIEKCGKPILSILLLEWFDLHYILTKVSNSENEIKNLEFYNDYKIIKQIFEKYKITTFTDIELKIKEIVEEIEKSLLTQL